MNANDLMSSHVKRIEKLVNANFYRIFSHTSIHLKKFFNRIFFLFFFIGIQISTLEQFLFNGRKSKHAHIYANNDVWPNVKKIVTTAVVEVMESVNFDCQIEYVQVIKRFQREFNRQPMRRRNCNFLIFIFCAISKLSLQTTEVVQAIIFSMKTIFVLKVR